MIAMAAGTVGHPDIPVAGSCAMISLRVSFPPGCEHSILPGYGLIIMAPGADGRHLGGINGGASIGRG